MFKVFRIGFELIGTKIHNPHSFIAYRLTAYNYFYGISYVLGGDKSICTA